ncbi:hypothetical protein HAZT_HAZT000099 [Hyalella azteca]|uniref:Malonyl-CoA decarboxylase C-terminal domain-containing protein n=1 Tax=Hyalella azteca TaxID=294128 RepID=A0A6A0H3W5_HYAAZ|nr:hypothetical protein HAZT_HAZT000099 [Hyalella azteca]
MRQSLQPPHAWVVTQVSRLTGGVKFLVDLRHHVLLLCPVQQLLQRGRDTPEEDAAVRELDATLREMLSLWFTVGLLQLSRVTWESSCSMLQKVRVMWESCSMLQKVRVRSLPAPCSRRLGSRGVVLLHAPEGQGHVGVLLHAPEGQGHFRVLLHVAEGQGHVESSCSMLQKGHMGVLLHAPEGQGHVESSCSMLQKISEYEAVHPISEYGAVHPVRNYQHLSVQISEYEAVHPVRNWTDLKRRVGQYRRCFVFTHSCMPSEPLVVLHTFLTDSISSSMNVIVQNPRFDRTRSCLFRWFLYKMFHFQPIKNSASEDRVDIPEEEEDSRTITAAVFYSITSTQKGLQMTGLKSIELGNYLIKRVVKELMAELPSLCMFSSLSPIPGFTKWLQSLLGRAARGEIRLFSDAEISELGRLLESSSTLELPTADKGSPSEGRPRPSDDASRPSSPENNAEDADDIRDPVTSHETRTVCRRVRQMLATNSWAQDEAFRRALEAPFMRLCAHYLYAEKRRGYALNSVG